MYRIFINLKHKYQNDISTGWQYRNMVRKKATNSSFSCPKLIVSGNQRRAEGG